jgi:hypothetical protein
MAARLSSMECSLFISGCQGDGSIPAFQTPGMTIISKAKLNRALKLFFIVTNSFFCVFLKK